MLVCIEKKVTKWLSPSIKKKFFFCKISNMLSFFISDRTRHFTRPSNGCGTYLKITATMPFLGNRSKTALLHDPRVTRKNFIAKDIERNFAKLFFMSFENRGLLILLPVLRYSLIQHGSSSSSPRFHIHCEASNWLVIYRSHLRSVVLTLDVE